MGKYLTSKGSSYRLNIWKIIFPAVDVIFFEAGRTCDTLDRKKQVGACFRIDRTDNKNVIFMEVKQ